LAWLASHELRLGWRDWVAMITVGHRRRMRTVVIGLIVFVGLMHLLAYSLVRRYALAGIAPDKATLVVVTGIMLLALSPLLSQAMELVTRLFYSRSDLDLILTSPISPRKIFSVRAASPLKLRCSRCCWRRHSSTCWRFSAACAGSLHTAW
jgi:ABC-2 type transport system permease protein